ncbi:UPF0287-domain-containing protein [Westerdykella ornata]|uniref:COX assembly mitochondrial protein n=1 Tax=Westerdykella ornata TaxID=318751 RepID=A0A6A6JYG3_WESOR|nr:UPF0287-domain-containing protein [Westerdykella ornata]KAF2281264.1 UPF0287-domain-containing protein [Westerdykella ornata]
MHPHLHTVENQTACAEVIRILDECYARGFLYKLTGSCTDAKLAVNKCLRAQRLERSRLNREEAKQKRQKIEAAWREIDENS